MDPTKWVGLGFVATAVNASPDTIKQMGCIRIVCPQICFGMSYPENDPTGSYAVQLFTGCRACGLDVAGWAWCCNPDAAEAEARYHADIVAEMGLKMFVCNMEEPYDAHGNSSDPRMFAPDRYAEAFRGYAPDVEFAVTTTPRWGSSGNGLRAAGACTMPQAFTAEVPSATIPACVDHAISWGWETARIRPLVQVYMTNGLRPDPGVYNADAARLSVGVSPYILEQAFDGDGMQMIATLAPSITRPPASGSTPVPPEPAKEPPPLPFKRALYPPDSKSQGKTPSKDGPDVEAIKRAISRAGYWKWQTFDQAYSNAFAHGGSSGPGVAGFQKDHVDLKGKPPSGWYGSATHEALRCFVIPSGPNAGQYVFDARAQELYKQA